jgi:hypothetical protein
MNEISPLLGYLLLICCVLLAVTNHDTFGDTVELYDGMSGKLIITCLKEAAIDCSAMGRNDEALEHWVKHPRTKFHVDHDTLIMLLKGTGGWTYKELVAEDIQLVRQRALWVLSHNWRDEQELPR